MDLMVAHDSKGSVQITLAVKNLNHLVWMLGNPGHTFFFTFLINYGLLLLSSTISVLTLSQAMYLPCAIYFPVIADVLDCN